MNTILIAWILFIYAKIVNDRRYKAVRKNKSLILTFSRRFLSLNSDIQGEKRVFQVKVARRVAAKSRAI